MKDNGLPERVGDVLVGASPGLRTRDTLGLAAELAVGFDATLRVLTVAPTGDGNASMERFLSDTRDHLADRLPSDRVGIEHVASADVAGIFLDRARASDLLVVGASRDWLSWRTLAGGFADDMANASTAAL